MWGGVETSKYRFRDNGALTGLAAEEARDGSFGGGNEWSLELSWRSFSMWSLWPSSFMYTSTASLFQRPRSLMSSREIPFAAAETAAPFLSEWPEKPFVEMPARRRSSLTLSTRYCLLNGPTVRANSGEFGLRGNFVKSLVRVLTGQIGEEGEAASWMSMPSWKGSVFEEGRVS